MSKQPVPAQTLPKQRVAGGFRKAFGLRKVGMVMATEFLHLGISSNLVQLRWHSPMQKKTPEFNLWFASQKSFLVFLAFFHVLQ